MSLFKRLSATLVSRIDQVVGEIENHDAVIQAALHDVRRKVAEARVRLTQVQRESERLQERIDEQQQHAERWRERARETAGSDEHRALECVRRARQCDQETERLRQAVAQYTQTAERLARDIDTSEQRMIAMKQKLALMRARQSTGSALSATSETESDVIRQLEESFDRWEINVSQLEMTVEHSDPVDPLEREFVSREQEASLRDELTALLSGEGKK